MKEDLNVVEYCTSEVHNVRPYLRSKQFLILIGNSAML